MSVRRKVFAGGALLGASQLASVVLRFGRSVFVARIVTPEDYGLAATFWITTDLLAMATDLGFTQRLIQARDGDDDGVGAVAQSLLALRGALTALVLLVCAGPIARLFDASEATWAFQLLAVIPLLQGLEHRDLDRVQRTLNFKPAVIAKLFPEIVTTVLAVPIAMKTRDYSTFLYLALISAFLRFCISHLLAERPFRFGWDRAVVGQFLEFGWPLIVNGLLMYAVMQGDRVVISTTYSKGELGNYSVAFMLGGVLVGVLRGMSLPLMLPLLAQVQDDLEAFKVKHRLHSQVVGAIAASIGLSCVLVGPTAIGLLYGERYALAGTVVGYLGIRQAIQVLMTSPAVAAMAKGDTRNMMYANMVRQTGILLMIAVAFLSLPIQWVAISGIVGEAAALTASVVLLRLRHSIPMNLLGRPAAFAGAWFVIALLLADSGFANDLWAMATLATAIVTAGALFWFSFPASRSELQKIIKELRQKFRAAQAI
jgi:O-antigen/teichoic acid export membrane protein